MFKNHALIAGAGIGGLAAALALARAGWSIDVIERSSNLTEVGAGIQLGPNSMSALKSLGLGPSLDKACYFPKKIKVFNALNGEILGSLDLATMKSKYKSPYCCIHRSDLQNILFQACSNQSDNKHQIQSHFNKNISNITQTEDAVSVEADMNSVFEGDVIVGADGLWSTVRQKLLNDGEPKETSHVAYRALIKQESLPPTLHTTDITIWLGPKLHLVMYPVRGGEYINVVAIVDAHIKSEPGNWNQEGFSHDLGNAFSSTCSKLKDLLFIIENWRFWSLKTRIPISNSTQQAQGRVALIGDAAHPMLPYLAQGAGMAIEDAYVLGKCFQNKSISIEMALKNFGEFRWRRNRQVQLRSRMNGHIFHLTGFASWIRNQVIRMRGEKILDMPWLYNNGPTSQSFYEE